MSLSHENNPLFGCKPVTGLPATDKASDQSIIRRALREEGFSRAGDPVTYACLIAKREGADRVYLGEDYHPVVACIQEALAPDIRSVAFHPCLSVSGAHFIYPQKIDPRGGQFNAWNASLAMALATPIGQWLKIWSDQEAKCYRHQIVQPLKDDKPEYIDFEEDLARALTPNIIQKMEHPLVQKVLQQRGAAEDLEEIY